MLGKTIDIPTIVRYNIIAATKPDAPDDANANAPLDDVLNQSDGFAQDILIQQFNYITSLLRCQHLVEILIRKSAHFADRKEGAKTNVREFLESKHLTVVWMQEQLKQRGYDVDLSHLCRILKGQRCSEQALRIVDEAKAICAKYESL